jgi:hypothetical protein
VEDVFLLSGDLRSVRSVSLNTPRGEGELQIRWMVDDGSEVKEGDRLVEFDAARLIQTIEERRLKLRQAENDRESRERSAAAEAERKRVAVDKAEVEAEKARIDAVVPRELRLPSSGGASRPPAGEEGGAREGPLEGGLLSPRARSPPPAPPKRKRGKR